MQQREIISKIYDRIQDEKSKNIFSNKLLHSLTGDAKFMQYIVKESCVGDELKEIVSKNPEKNMVIFGAGELGKWIYDCFCETPWCCVECFLDNNKSGEDYRGIPIIRPDGYGEKIYQAIIFVCSWLFREEQCRQLLEMGVLKENIIDVVDVMFRVRNTKQYFELPELKRQGAEEVFIDGGCFDGIYSVQFVEWCKGEYKRVYAFEPDKSNYLQCKIMLQDLGGGNRIKVFNKGLGEYETNMQFYSDGLGSRFSKKGNDVIEVVSLDKIIEEKVTFLKLDIEGAECMAIRGAKNIISHYKPKCAICVYHKLGDIWEIPSLLLKYNPDYHLFFRHYSLNGNETVVYAV